MALTPPLPTFSSFQPLFQTWEFLGSIEMWGVTQVMTQIVI